MLRLTVAPPVDLFMNPPARSSRAYQNVGRDAQGVRGLRDFQSQSSLSESLSEHGAGADREPKCEEEKRLRYSIEHPL